MTTTFTWEAAALDIVTAPIILIVQAVAGIIWLIAQCLRFVLSAAQENWQPIVKLTLIVAVTFVAVTNPHITIGVILIAAYAKLTK